ncbi:MAG: alpha/beta hydrolase-fold protein [Meiothermus sp.]|uniref:alpha/beta hydrolase n=1 Tax=Meiothermus sp. TaxID=1955249 RepID=UPI0025EEE3BF|nr:alpha/beta hydrolase-fold protein [Meiothermus sp.]MCS7193961.1 alpha/beta hydrolase-fold protein [Meiothermus sp.]MCX7740316.1 alpha/beta hydrolase-fold protein [Meiothermus sp.]
MVEVHHRSVTFYPPARARFLVGDFTDWDRRPIPIEGPLTLEFPPGAYIEYAFLDEDREPFPDPDNPRKAQNPWWSYPRAIELPGFQYATPHQPSRPVEVDRHRLASRVFGTPRRYYVYNPQEPAQATLYVHDGVAYYRTAKLAEVAQGLLEQGQIDPVRIVFIEPEDRRQEYWFSTAYERHLLDELIPAVEAQYGPTPERGLLGASLGGLISGWLALRHPQVFQKVATQSACLTASPKGGDSYTDPEWLTEQYQVAETLPLRFYCETGQIEWLLAPNRRFAAMLADKGYPHLYQERPSGHNWMTWRQGLAPALLYLFGSR